MATLSTFNTFVSRSDTFGVDDFTVGSHSQAVPEPLTILGSLVAGIVGVALRRKYKQQH